jgi:hypothetical protein
MGGSSGERSEILRSNQRVAASWASSVFLSRSAERMASIAAPRNDVIASAVMRRGS